MEQPLEFSENDQRDNARIVQKNGDTSPKLPFNDATNITKGEVSQSTASLKKEEDDSLDYLEKIECPKNNACFCCGKNRKLDGEILFRNLIDPDFLKMLDDNLRMPEFDESSPPSPIDLSDFPKIPSPPPSPEFHPEFDDEIVLPMPESPCDFLNDEVFQMPSAYFREKKAIRHQITKK